MLAFAAASASFFSGVSANLSRFSSLSAAAESGSSSRPLETMRSIRFDHLLFGFLCLSLSSGISTTTATSRSSKSNTAASQ